MMMVFHKIYKNVALLVKPVFNKLINVLLVLVNNI